MANESNYESQHLSGDEALEKVRGLLKNFRNTMMVTRTSDSLHSRPMALQGEMEEFEGTLWFFTDKHGRKVDEIGEEPSVSLIFQSDGDSAFLHLFGVAQMVDDAAKKEELYKPILKTWFPGGLEDPNMTLIRFEAERGDYWDSPGGMLQVLGAFTKALVTGQRGQGGEMGDVKL